MINRMFFAILALIYFGLSLAKNDVLSFIALGDWGKGGNSGDITTKGRNLDASLADDDVYVAQWQSAKHSDQQASKNNDQQTQQYYTYQAAIAKSMGTYAVTAEIAPSFVVSLGDNFYVNGVSSSTDSLWESLWSEVYIDPYPALNVSWYPIFGNHDYGYGLSGIEAQIQRYRDHVDGDLWQFPATNYSKTFSIPGGNGTVTVIFIDTTTLAPSENKCCNSKGYYLLILVISFCS